MGTHKNHHDEAIPMDTNNIDSYEYPYVLLSQLDSPIHLNRGKPLKYYLKGSCKK